MAPRRSSGGARKGGRPSAAELAERDALAARWRPLMKYELVTDQESGAKRIVQGEAHFNARQQASKALDEAIVAVMALYKLGAYPRDDLDKISDHVIAARRALGNSMPVAGQFAEIAAVLADAEPGKRWIDVEARALGVLEYHGIIGAADPAVLAKADGMRTVKAFKEKRRRRR